MKIIKKILYAFGVLLSGIVVLMFHAWSVLALYFCVSPDWSLLKIFLMAGYVLSVFVIVFKGRGKIRALFLSLVVYLFILVWFMGISPAENAEYPKELTLPKVEFNGDLVTIKSVRNCEYRTRYDFDVRYEKRIYDLRDLQTVDLYVNYWGMDAIAHTFVSFGFSDGRYLPVSIEIRPAKGKVYGMIKGFFKQYELIYIWGDERDLVRTRTNYRREDAYLYRTNFTPKEARELITEMLEETDSIYSKQQFYNTATHSCTNTIGDAVLKSVPTRQFAFWERRLLTGTVDKRMYDQGWLETYGKSFEELRKEALINKRAQAADKDPDFSQKIRTHLGFDGK